MVPLLLLAASVSPLLVPAGRLEPPHVAFGPPALVSGVSAHPDDFYALSHATTGSTATQLAQRTVLVGLLANASRHATSGVDLYVRSAVTGRWSSRPLCAGGTPGESFAQIGPTQLRRRGGREILERVGNFTSFSTIGDVIDLELSPSGHVEVKFQSGSVTYSGLPRPGSQFRINSGNTLRLPTAAGQPDSGQLLSFSSIHFVGDGGRSSIGCFASEDDGLHWAFRSVAARASDFLQGKEGPNESGAAVLSDGSVLLAFRTSDGTESNEPYSFLRSMDAGHSWQSIGSTGGGGSGSVSPGSVRPRLLRLGRTLLLTGGRPGMFLWVATDPTSTAAVDSPGLALEWTMRYRSENASFAPFCTKNASFYHDRLGTNIGKSQKDVCFLAAYPSSTTNARLIQRSGTAHVPLLPI
eukprot:COSAG06_NODE_1511_length_9233_cov_3.730896_8_plen_411_part_00